MEDGERGGGGRGGHERADNLCLTALACVARGNKGGLSMLPNNVVR